MPPSAQLSPVAPSRSTTARRLPKQAVLFVAFAPARADPMTTTWYSKLTLARTLPVVSASPGAVRLRALSGLRKGGKARAALRRHGRSARRGIFVNRLRFVLQFRIVAHCGLQRRRSFSHHRPAHAWARAADGFRLACPGLRKRALGRAMRSFAAESQFPRGMLAQREREPLR